MRFDILQCSNMTNLLSGIVPGHSRTMRRMLGVLMRRQNSNIPLPIKNGQTDTINNSQIKISFRNCPLMRVTLCRNVYKPSFNTISSFSQKRAVQHLAENLHGPQGEVVSPALQHQKFDSILDFLTLIDNMKDTQITALSPEECGTLIASIKNTINNSEHSDHALSMKRSVQKALRRSRNLARLTHILSARSDQVATQTLIAALSSLLYLHNEDKQVVTVIEAKLEADIEGLSYGELLNLAGIHMYQQQTPLRQEVFQKAVAKLREKVSLLDNGEDIRQGMDFALKSLDQKLFQQLEKRALEVCEQLGSFDLSEIMFYLAQERRRNVPLMRTVAYHLTAQNMKGQNEEAHLTLDQLQKLLWSASMLNFSEEKFMQTLTSALMVNIKELKEKNENKFDKSTLWNVEQIFHSLSTLRWDSQELIDALFEIVFLLDSEILAKRFPSILLALASLGYVPGVVQKNESFKNIVIEALCTISPNSKKYLETIWSLAVLGQVEPQHIQRVLDIEFTKKLLGKDNDSVPVKLKLMNINAVAKLELKHNIDFSLHEEASTLTPILQIPSKTKRPLYDAVASAVDDFASGKKYLLKDVTTPYGYLIDIEMIVNNSGEPQPVTEYAAKFPWQQGGTKELPLDFHRIAIKVLDFTDMTRVQKQPVGLHAMATRHLCLAGYTVVQIPYYEFNCLTTAVSKIQYVQGKIKSSIKES